MIIGVQGEPESADPEHGGRRRCSLRKHYSRDSVAGYSNRYDQDDVKPPYEYHPTAKIREDRCVQILDGRWIHRRELPKRRLSLAQAYEFPELLPLILEIDSAIRKPGKQGHMYREKNRQNNPSIG